MSACPMPPMSAYSASRPGHARGQLALWALLACLLVGLPTLARPAAAGILAEASCPCGYHLERLPLFGGFANFRTVCLFPALCRDKGSLVLINLLDPGTRPASCPTGPLASLADPAVAPVDGESVAEWRLADNRVIRLLGGGYPCPRCGQMTLHFRQTGFWD